MHQSRTGLAPATGRPRTDRGILARTFLEHPASVGESYFEHMRFALRFGGRLGMAAMAALVHALVPSLCKHTASRAVRDLVSFMDSRGHTGSRTAR